MKSLLLVVSLLITALTSFTAAAADPLRVFIRSGPKSHGPGAHDYPRFLKEWVPMLNARGARATGSEAFPTKAQLDETDVLILHKQEAGNVDPADRINLNDFLARGGGLVVIHAGTVSRDPDWFKGIVGGSWRNGTTKWLEGPMHLYLTDRDSPITKDASNWSMDDEIYYDMDMLPDVRVLATAYTPKASGARNANSQRRADELTGGGKVVSIFDTQPQMWTYERTADGGRTPYRAFVSIPGHLYKNFDRPNYRSILLRGIAWAGKRQNVDELLKKEELGDALRYVEGGPTAPAKATATIEVHPEFDLTLVAAEPLIAKAMNIDWDDRGRLWVSETPEYPNGRKLPNTEPWKESGSLRRRQDRDPEDTISILSDTNGDGVMDRKHVFADKLELVTGFVFHRSGVIAATSPDIWYLEDTNGDEVADRRTKLYTGLGTFDTHAVINNLRWGLDGWIYATHGYSTGTVTSGDGTKNFGRDGSGVVRFKPDGSAFEQYSSRGGNTWGLDITWDGQVFWTQPTSGTVLFHTVLPESILAKGRIPGTTSWKGMITGQKTFPAMSWPEQAYVQIDLVGQFTAAAGCAIYDGGAWPGKWRYAYFTGEPTLNIVHQQFVVPEGVSYASHKEVGREQTEFIRSTDLWFRPIETRVGPDGALYVVDFYNQAVIHNDTRGPLHGPANAAVRPDRDHFFGRIWRVQHKQATKLAVPVLKRGDLAQLLQVMEKSPNAHVKKTAWRLAQENHASDPRLAQIRKGIDSRGSKALELYEQARAATTPAQRKVVLDGFASADDNWTRSALVAAATEQASSYVTEALTHERPQRLTDFVAAVVPAALPDHAQRLLIAAAGASPAAVALKTSIVRAVARMEGGAIALDSNAEATAALQKLLDDPATTAAALPIVAKWDKAGVLRAKADGHAQRMLRDLGDAGMSDERRADSAAGLLAVPGSRPQVLAAIGPMLSDPAVSTSLKNRLIAALGETAGSDVDAVIIAVLARTNSTPLFDQLLKRPDSSLELLASMKEGKITPANLGPANVARLRTHPNRQVAREAAAVLDALAPGAKAKSDVVETLLPEIEKPGDGTRGRMLFTGACSSCHKLGNIGKSLAGPPLDGMGAHGRAELLAHIVDPNREVDPSFWQWNVTTRKGETLAGVIASENAASLTLRNATGDVEIKKEDIATRENTRRSLMPEGLEALGAEALRDILAFLAGEGNDQKFRLVNLRQAYTADSRRGFRRDEERDETVTLHRFGDVSVAGVPFFVMDPARSASGANLIALKGGPGRGNLSDDFPQRVEIPTPVTAASLHFLGGVGGWAWPTGGETTRGTPVMKVVVFFADGTSEEHVLKNGEHFADTFVRAEVPLSTDAGDFVRRGQLRYFALNLEKKGTLSKIVLESFDTDIVPATVAITAGTEPVASRTPAPAGQAQPASATPKEGGRGDAPLPETKPIVWADGTKVLIIGGGSSHNFGRFFGETDSATLTAAGFSVNYTEDRDQAAAEIGKADVAVISVNRQFFDTPAWRKAVFDFAAAGKGLVMLHPGTWYGYAQWPELNAAIVGGGSRGHDRIAKFSVNAVKPDHPVMKGVPASFEVEDELYYMNAEADKIPPGTASIEVLAETSPSVRFKQPHPAVWITRHASARIVGIALGHDERVHDHPAFKTLLANAVKWAGTAQPKPFALFDGKTFAGWEGDLAIFRIQDGAIVGGTLERKIVRNEFLCTTRTYADFELRLKVKLLGGEGANAGIQFRTKRIPNHHEVSGYQADMGTGYWGALYDESRRNKILKGPDQEQMKRVIKADDWNEYVIRAEGRRIQLRINGVQTVDYVEQDSKIETTGLICVQIHGGPPTEAWYRDLTLLDLSSR